MLNDISKFNFKDATEDDLFVYISNLIEIAIFETKRQTGIELNRNEWNEKLFQLAIKKIKEIARVPAKTWEKYHAKYPQGRVIH